MKSALNWSNSLRSFAPVCGFSLVTLVYFLYFSAFSSFRTNGVTLSTAVLPVEARQEAQFNPTSWPVKTRFRTVESNFNISTVGKCFKEILIKSRSFWSFWTWDLLIWSSAFSKPVLITLRLQFGGFGFLSTAFILNLRSSDLKQCIQYGSFASVLKFSFAALVFCLSLETK